MVKHFPEIYSLLIALALNSCTSNHDLQSDDINYFGGGTDVFKVGEGKYKIISKTNLSPFENFPTARKMWADVAHKTCNSSNYTKEHTEEYTQTNVPTLFFNLYLTSIKSGYIVCTE